MISGLCDPNSFHDRKETLGSPQSKVKAEAGGGIRKGALTGPRVAASNQGAGMV